jgi:hypothetical protein
MHWRGDGARHGPGHRGPARATGGDRPECRNGRLPRVGGVRRSAERSAGSRHGTTPAGARRGRVVAAVTREANGTAERLAPRGTPPGHARGRGIGGLTGERAGWACLSGCVTMKSTHPHHDLAPDQRLKYAARVTRHQSPEYRTEVIRSGTQPRAAHHRENGHE